MCWRVFVVASNARCSFFKGAMYFTIKYLAPPKYVPIIAWIDGWLNLIGQICGSASSSYGAAQMLLAAVSISSDFTYFPTQGHVIAVMTGLSIFHGLINSLNTKWLHQFAKTYAAFHITVLLALLITLLVMQKDKHTAEYAFTHVESSSGWSPPGFSFLFGFLSVSWTMTDYDAAAHIAEEVRNPAKTVPWAIASALTFTYVVGWLYNIVLVFTMGDPAELLASPIGQPVAQLFYNVMGKGASIFFTVAAFIIMNFVCITALQAGSRTVWAFARDEMLPGWRIWYKIWKRTDTPVLAVWLYTLICILINLIGLGSVTTISAIFNLCSIALDWSYVIPIACKLAFNRFERGPWHLGGASFAINVWAVVWTVFVSVIFVLPTVMPVTALNVRTSIIATLERALHTDMGNQMNYASVILVFVMLIATVYWYARGRFYYTGPRANAHIENGHIVEDESPSAVLDQEKAVSQDRPDSPGVLAQDRKQSNPSRES